MFRPVERPFGQQKESSLDLRQRHQKREIGRVMTTLAEVGRLRPVRLATCLRTRQSKGEFPCLHSPWRIFQERARGNPSAPQLSFSRCIGHAGRGLAGLGRLAGFAGLRHRSGGAELHFNSSPSYVPPCWRQEESGEGEVKAKVQALVNGELQRKPTTVQGSRV